jgi:hypothetical protein
MACARSPTRPGTTRTTHICRSLARLSPGMKHEFNQMLNKCRKRNDEITCISDEVAFLVLHRHLARFGFPDAAIEPFVFARPMVPRGCIDRAGRKGLCRVNHSCSGSGMPGPDVFITIIPVIRQPPLPAPCEWQLPDLDRRQRHVEVRNAIRLERITTALTTAGGAPVAPASPAPFTPSGLEAVGASWLNCSSRCGMSLARGMQ